LLPSRLGHLDTLRLNNPRLVTEIPSGYRDWRLISVAHEEGDLHSFAVVLGNDAAIKAYREGKPLFPDGAIIAASHYHHVSSQENNKVFGRDQSFVPGPPKPSTDGPLMDSCFACHQQVKARDLVFTLYAP
jgi:hypothetical protein